MPSRRLKTGKLFELAGLSQGQQRTLARALIGRNLQRIDGRISLPPDTGLDEATLERLRFTLKITEFADDHEETVRELVQDERVHSLRDLARNFDPQDWQVLVERASTNDGKDLPDDLEGDTPAARRVAYARRLYTRTVTAYPTVAMAYGLSRRKTLADNPAVQLLPRMVEADERFDLASARLDAYMVESRGALGLESDDDVRTATQEIKRVQRLYRLKPEMAVVARLLEDQEHLDSATAIVHKGKRRFMETYGADNDLGHVRRVPARSATHRERLL